MPRKKINWKKVEKIQDEYDWITEACQAKEILHQLASVENFHKLVDTMTGTQWCCYLKRLGFKPQRRLKDKIHWRDARHEKDNHQ